MAGKHAKARTSRSRVGLVSAAAVGVALVIGGAVGAIRLVSQPTAADSPVIAMTASATPTDTATASPTAGVTPTPASPKPTASPGRASRGKPRTAAPSPSASKTTASPKVVGTGSCGASYYDQGQTTANGETFNPDALTAAHKTWAFNTRVRVTNPTNGKSVVVRINDRGPYVNGRCIDLSRGAFQAIASLSQGELNVRYEILG